MSESVRHMVEYLMPGTFFSEETTRQLDERSVEEAVRKVPEGAFCFTLYDQPLPPIDLGDGFTVIGKSRNRSPKHYLGGSVYSCAEVEAMGPSKEILTSNMKSNGWGWVIRTPFGNWQPFEADDVLLPAPDSVDA